MYGQKTCLSFTCDESELESAVSDLNITVQAENISGTIGLENIEPISTDDISNFGTEVEERLDGFLEEYSWLGDERFKSAVRQMFTEQITDYINGVEETRIVLIVKEIIRKVLYGLISGLENTSIHPLGTDTKESSNEVK